MPQERLTVKKILEILRLHFEHGLSGRAIALAVCCALSSVQECLRRFSQSGLSWPVECDEDVLIQRLYPKPSNGAADVDYAAVVERLRSFKGITRERVWREYRHDQPGGISYSAFCAGLSRFMKLQKLSARQFHAPGSAMFVDYAGPPLWLVDRHTGERQAVSVFVAALGFSSAVFALATRRQSSEDWLQGHSLALEYFGGVPQRVVPDNAKALVQKPHRYEPELNRVYQEWAEHYGCAVIPARVRHPQDKAKVEQSVLLLERWVYPELMAQTFFDLGTLNHALRALLDALNARPFQKRDGSRSEALVEERHALSPLPNQRFRYGHWRRAKVPLDYHVEVEQRFYSVPYRLVGKTVDVRQSANVLELYHHGKRVASHTVLDRRGACHTLPEHQPPQHAPRQQAPILARAEAIGPATLAFVQRQLHQRKHPELIERAMLGILRLAKDYSETALEAACAQAELLGISSSRLLIALLKTTPSEAPPPATPLHHEHVRGADYFGAAPCSIH